MSYFPATPDRLAQVAVELAVRVRDEDPAVNREWLASVLPDERDWFRLAFVLAAAIPDDQPWKELTKWVDGPAALREVGKPARVRRTKPKAAAEPPPCGTRRGAQRHRRRQEAVCAPCLAASNEYQATYRQNRRNAA